MPVQIPKAIDMSVQDPTPTVAPDFGQSVIGVPDGIGPPSTSGTIFDLIARSAPAAPPRLEPAPQKKPEVIVPRAPIRVSIGVQAAKLIRQVKPVYPQLAKNARISGTVRLVAIIGKGGAIENLQVSAGHPLLVPAAVEAVKQWLYQPTLLSGEPVDVITQIEVNFTLSQ